MPISRTEIGSAFSSGREVSMKQNGVTEHEWLTARDQNVRQSHQIDGEVRPIGVSFSNGLTRPLQTGAPAGEVINCRCATLPVIEEAA